MGEEAKQPEQEQAKEETEAEERKEEKTEEKKEEKAEEKKEEPKPPSPFVLFVDLHCVGCAKKIEKSILNMRGVEGVVIDMAQNQVTIKGVVEPQAICTKIMKKAKRRAKVLSPLPAAEDEPIPQLVNSQVSGLKTVELSVNMHCEACAEQLNRKILKMRGVRTATTELRSSKVIVTGTMEPNRLVDYVYRHTKKQAKIVLPQPEPEKPAEAQPKPEEKKEEDKKPADEPKPEEKKEELAAAEKKGGGEKPQEEEEKKEENKNNNNNNKSPPPQDQDDQVKEGLENMMMSSSSISTSGSSNYSTEEQIMQKMMHYYQPLYVIERIPPPQLFSDENPNACCIS